jgi:collagenase-like PrtC family protease
METLEFSVPYNNDRETLWAIIELKRWNNNSIREIYFSGPQEYCGSGRVTPEIDMKEFSKTVEQIHKAGIQVNLILNSTCEGIEWYSQEVMAATMEYLKEVHEGYGVETVTIANPLYISEARKRFPCLGINASVLCEIDCVKRAMLYKQAGADILITDANINRNLKLLKTIKETAGIEIKLMANEGCLYKCPFRLFHFNAMSHASKEIRNSDHMDVSVANFFGVCNQVIANDHSELLKSCWIRPEDTRKYDGITNYFKLVGRSQLKSFIIRTVRAYMEENWDGDFFDLIAGGSKRFCITNGAYLDNKSLEKYNFFETVTECGRDCTRCNYCGKIADSLIRLKMFTKAKAMDSGHEYN